MKKSIFAIAALALVLAACNKTEKFHVEGTIENAANQYVYLEHNGLIQNEVLDSAYLTSTGSFSFKAPRPEYPDFYRLRVAGKSIVLAVDSLETIGVKANTKDILNTTFENSPKSELIQKLRRSLINDPIDKHKAYAQALILNDPASLVAYYALFQQKAAAPIFRLEDPQDRVYYRAVATSWNVWMPENERTKVLYQQVIDQINSERRTLNTAMMQQYINEQEGSTFLDITMKDANDEKQSLSSLKGNVILLDFCSTEMDQYESYLTSLYDRYDRYHNKGLEIYQVYPDQTVMNWKNAVKELPWITVRSTKGLTDPVYATYNVHNIPTLFLINRKGEVVGRYVGFKDLDADIEKVL